MMHMINAQSCTMILSRDRRRFKYVEFVSYLRCDFLMACALLKKHHTIW